MASFHHRVKSGKKGTATEHATYIARQGKHRHREDLVCAGHGNLPAWSQDDPIRFWRTADAHERANGAVYREHEIALPGVLSREQQIELAQTLVQELIGDKAYQYAIHAPDSALEGVTNAHLHLMYSGRIPDGFDRGPAQMFARHNPVNPARGGCKKEGGGRSPLQVRADLITLRKHSADIQNAALARYGYDVRVDHRSLKEQGIERQPERHLGPARIRSMSEREKVAYVAARRDARLSQTEVGTSLDWMHDAED
ncbi:MobA/MobL family protein [Xanthomonas sp. NCPPB 1068]|uniref:MobA/MobL family protein n=1 Tax=Xanthomonas sp. NCPPB 1068 TaxID=487525 RepID=UPI0035560AD9